VEKLLQAYVYIRCDLDIKVAMSLSISHCIHSSCSCNVIKLRRYGGLENVAKLGGVACKKGMVTAVRL